jgi:hypothetical protein
MKLRCPSCRGSFPWDTGGGWPRYCPLCSYDTSMDDQPEVAAPHVRSGMAKARLQSADQTYRAMEASSAGRAQDAADMLGVPVTEMSDLKITDAQTSLREGDAAVKPVSNPVSQTMDARPGVFGFQGAAQGSNFATNAHTGVMPDGPYRGAPIVGDVRHAGAKASSLVRDFHMKHADAMVRRGEQGRH